MTEELPPEELAKEEKEIQEHLREAQENKAKNAQMSQ